jgi:hypothetical protein
MQLRTSKEHEVYGRMTAALEERGFWLMSQPFSAEDAVQYAMPDRQWDEWSNGKLRVTILHTASMDDPIRADIEGTDMAAWNAKGLHICLDHAEEAA